MWLELDILSSFIILFAAFNTRLPNLPLRNGTSTLHKNIQSASQCKSNMAKSSSIYSTLTDKDNHVNLHLPVQSSVH